MDYLIDYDFGWVYKDMITHANLKYCTIAL